MADIDHLIIVQLGSDDARAGPLLSEEAHWNQNEADWRFFLTTGTVYGVREENHLCATAALLPYTAANAWISMVLVTASWRRRCLATRLLDACLDAAAKQGLTTWLDATPAGATVYGPLGFTPTLHLQRLRYTCSAPRAATLELESNGSFDEFIARDCRAMGFDRSTLLGELGGRPGSRLISRNGAIGLIRDGRKARHIGPLFADDTASATALVGAIVEYETGPFLIDVVGEQRKFLESLTDSGWTIERPFQRMRFGRTATESVQPPFAVAGPEFG